MLFSEPFGGLMPGAQGAVAATLLRTGTPLTGRQVHALVRERHSLWAVQEALKALTRIGLVQTLTVGRAGVHTINEDHVTVGPLRALLDPIAQLVETVRRTVGDDVHSVILFGSVGRGDATASSDVDLAVIAPADWDRRIALEDAVRLRHGNECDVLVFTPEDFSGRLVTTEPVVQQIRAEGVALIGTIPQTVSGAL